MDSRPVIDLDGRSVHYSVRRSNRAKRLLLRLDRLRGLEVVLPRGVPMSEAEPALRRHTDWVLKHLERFETEPPGGRPELTEGQVILFRGEEHALRFHSSVRNHAYRRGARLIVALDLLGSMRRLHRPVLEHWLREQARIDIAGQVQALCREHGFEHNGLFIRDQKTRWGSCSRQRNLSFSWRLILAPPNVLRYVVAHEVCHLREWGHTEAFWRLLEAVCPDYRECRRWLDEHGPRLRF